MSKIVVINNLTLDGVMQAPGRADEDTRDGFTHGGWAVMPNDDPDIGRAMGERMAHGGPLLFGRRTYEDFHSFLAEPTRQSLHRCSRQHPEVRRVDDA